MKRRRKRAGKKGGGTTTAPVDFRMLDDQGEFEAVCEAVRQEAERLSGEDWPMRSLLKKARLPRLAKAVSR